MLINSDFLLPHLQNKKWHKKTTNDRHIICPKCKVRTKLDKLKDQRRKCSRCDKKFVAKRKIEQRLPKQNADTIVGFCLDFSALKTAKLFNYRYRFVLGTYNKIRYILTKESLMVKKWSGIVEVDESYFGGENRKRSKKYGKKYVGRGRGTDKTPVFGIIERGDKVFIDILKDLTGETVGTIITKKVKPGSNVMSDEFQSYKGLIYKGYIHRFVEHRKEQYAKGQVHVNGIENFWSWAKEYMIKFHGIFRHNLIYYLKEIEWKFNHRKLSIEEKSIAISKLICQYGNIAPGYS